MENVLSAVSSVVEEAEQVSYPGNDSSERKSKKGNGLTRRKKMNVRKQKELIEELMQTALIVRDFESRYNLSLELLKLNTVEPMPEETIMKIRQKYKLNSAVWIKAELTIQEGAGNEEPEQ